MSQIVFGIACGLVIGIGGAMMVWLNRRSNPTARAIGMRDRAVKRLGR